MVTKSTSCRACGTRTTSHTGFCRWCKSRRHRGHERVRDEGLVVDQAGGSWWVWDRRGEVLVAGKPTRDAAVIALGAGDVEDEDDDEHARKKTSAELDREVAAILRRRS
jgi:hypothetical protein